MRIGSVVYGWLSYCDNGQLIAIILEINSTNMTDYISICNACVKRYMGVVIKAPEGGKDIGRSPLIQSDSKERRYALRQALPAWYLATPFSSN